MLVERISVERYRKVGSHPGVGASWALTLCGGGVSQDKRACVHTSFSYPPYPSTCEVWKMSPEKGNASL